MVTQKISDYLADARAKNLYRSCKVLEESRAASIVFGGQKYLNFSSNDYLGLSAHPSVISAGMAALKKYGGGARASRLISGTTALHAQLEQSLSRFKQMESALLFPTGFMANLGVLSALLGKNDAVIMDRLTHASLLDAVKLSGCRLFIYDHCSTENLEKLLHRTRAYDNRWVVTDALFSMDGDFAPLKEMVALCKSQKVPLMIDDAHATGILGKTGIGMAEHCGVLGQIDIVVGTLSKALGSQGGFVCASRQITEFLVNKSRPFIYTTGLSPVSCAVALESLNQIIADPQRRKKALHLSSLLRKKLAQNFEHFKPGENSLIVSFPVGSADRALKLDEHLRRKNIYAPAIRPPTVPRGESRLRFSITSDHRESDIEHLTNALKTFKN